MPFPVLFAVLCGMKTNSKGKIMKMNIAVNLALVPLSVLTLLSGIGLHLAGHGPDHHVWHNWAALHTVFSLFMLAAVATHVKLHWKWYRNLKTASFRKKSRATMFLTLLFTSVGFTGLMLLMFVSGAGSEAGLIHYAAGLMLSASCFLHILKRRKILLNVLNRRK